MQPTKQQFSNETPGIGPHIGRYHQRIPRPRGRMSVVVGGVLTASPGVWVFFPGNMFVFFEGRDPLYFSSLLLLKMCLVSLWNPWKWFLCASGLYQISTTTWLMWLPTALGCFHATGCRDGVCCFGLSGGAEPQFAFFLQDYHHWRPICLAQSLFEMERSWKLRCAKMPGTTWKVRSQDDDSCDVHSRSTLRLAMLWFFMGVQNLGRSTRNPRDDKELFMGGTLHKAQY